MRTKQFHILKVINLFLLIVIISSCSSSNPSVRIGKYANVIPNKLTLYYYEFFHNSGFNVGDTLTIIDSINYTFRTCGGINYGKYYITNDSLHLKNDSSYIHYGSIMKINKYENVYYIKSNKLLIGKFRAKVSKKSDKYFTAIDELHYIE